MSDSQVILHYYDRSPFSQKMAWALQFKRVDYRIVMIPRTEPRPLRRPLDGGYRKTPVLQIGNHTYCDSKLIFAELERRYPEPTFYPTEQTSKDTCFALSQWTNNSLFLSVASQIHTELIQDEFLEDRSTMLGRKMTKEAVLFTAPFMLQSIISEFKVLESFVKNNLFTKTMSEIDLHVAKLTWFIQDTAGPEILKNNVPILYDHLQRFLVAIRNDEVSKRPTMEAEEALEFAKRYTWELNEPVHDGSCMVALESTVAVAPTDIGIIPVVGKLVHSTMEETVIEKTDEETGITAFIHFPVIGFVVLPVA